MNGTASRWGVRVLWSLGGFALAAVLLGPSERPWRSLGSHPSSAPPSDVSPGPAAPELPAGAPGPECYLGVVVARESVDVAAEIEGILETVQVRVGERARQGQRLATLDTRMLRYQLEIERTALDTAEAQRRRAELAVERSRQEEQRRETLAGEDLLSREEAEGARFDLDQAVADLAAAEAGVAQARARIQQSEARLRQSEILAPMNGTVSRRYLDPGAMVAPGTRLVRLISNRQMARFAVPPEDSDALTVGAAVRVEVETRDRPLTGRIAHLAPEIDPASQLIFIEAHLDAVPLPALATEPFGLPSGAVARISVIRNSVASPASCLEIVPDTRQARR